MRIELRKGVFLEIDPEDEAVAKMRTWRPLRRVTPSGREYVYADAKIDGKHVLMHRLLTGAARGQVVDHIDGNGLNNTRANLRLCTHAENMRNRRANAAKDLPKGVHRYATDRFRAEIRFDGQRRRQYGFATAEEAAACYESWSREVHGEFARKG